MWSLLLPWSLAFPWHIYPGHFRAAKSFLKAWRAQTPKTTAASPLRSERWAFCRIVGLCQPCQDLPKGVACQSAKCVRARQEPGRITSPAWPGAPSCPWTSAQLWTGNKRRDISYKTTVVLHRTKNEEKKKLKTNKNTLISWVNWNYIFPRY